MNTAHHIITRCDHAMRSRIVDFCKPITTCENASQKSRLSYNRLQHAITRRCTVDFHTTDYNTRLRAGTVDFCTTDYNTRLHATVQSTFAQPITTCDYAPLYSRLLDNRLQHAITRHCTVDFCTTDYNTRLHAAVQSTFAQPITTCENTPLYSRLSHNRLQHAKTRRLRGRLRDRFTWTITREKLQRFVGKTRWADYTFRTPIRMADYTTHSHSDSTPPVLHYCW
jgi:hypothetical protein